MMWTKDPVDCVCHVSEESARMNVCACVCSGIILTEIEVSGQNSLETELHETVLFMMFCYPHDQRDDCSINAGRAVGNSF